MSAIDRSPIVVGEPNWVPLERALSPRDRQPFMYMGRVGDIELYKDCLTRRYLNISSDGRRFYRHVGNAYIEIARAEAIAYVNS